MPIWNAPLDAEDRVAIVVNGEGIVALLSALLLVIIATPIWLASAERQTDIAGTTNGFEFETTALMRIISTVRCACLATTGRQSYRLAKSTTIAIVKSRPALLG
jgi:hypothetical protein